MARKLNVLVYTGAGPSPASVKFCLLAFRQILFHKYAIVPIDETTVVKEPWDSTCALFVVPSAVDHDLCCSLGGESGRRINNYVRAGGAYLEFSVRKLSSVCISKGDTDKEPSGSLETQRAGFPCGICHVGLGDVNSAEQSGGVTGLKINETAFKDQVPKQTNSYAANGYAYIDIHDAMLGDFEVLALCDDEPNVGNSDSRAAVLLCTVENGKALLVASQLEVIAGNLNSESGLALDKTLLKLLANEDESRLWFLKSCLRRVGIDAGETITKSPGLSSFHLSSISNADLTELVRSWDAILGIKDGRALMKGGANVFQVQLYGAQAGWPGKVKVMDGEDETDYTTALKIVVHDATPPENNETPQFDHKIYYDSLKTYRHAEKAARTWGNLLLYGEVVSSTNTLLESNSQLLATLPAGFTLAASSSVAARGRGNNVWIAPPGSVIFSTVIVHSASVATSRPIVFIQYIMSIAIAEGILSYGQGYESLPVKIKWPNDIYARDPKDPEKNYVKIGGFLTQCSYIDGSFKVVIGLGMNTLNPGPTTCIADLLPLGVPPLHVESLLARIVSRLESLYSQFLQEGFSSDLEARYYRQWLHTGQQIRLEEEGGVRARVLGITNDWGMLRVEETDNSGMGTGKIWALQTDENSFDYWKGLVRKKRL